MSTIDVTVALPTWNSQRIIWLQLESLCRQVTTVGWEIIVEECESNACRDILNEYYDRLKQAGCIAVRHYSNDERLMLGDKWRRIAQRAEGTCLILAASDNYSPPDRVQRAHDVINKAGYDWTDTGRGLFYDIPSGQEGTWIRMTDSRSGLWMACRTEHIRRLYGDPPPRNIDGWIKSQLPEGFRWLREEGERAGVHTDGVNTISHHRSGLYVDNMQVPFIAPTQHAEEILPDGIMRRLRSMSQVAAA